MESERAKRISEVLVRAGYQALVCRMPQNVVMLTGYWPVLGNSFCVVSLNSARVPELRLAVPTDEADLVPEDVAVEVKTFAEETLSYIGTTLEAVRQPLGDLLQAAGLHAQSQVGYEGGHAPIATAYTQVGVPGPATLDLLRALLPDATLDDATALLNELGAIKTDAEVDHIKRSAAVAAEGFTAAHAAIRVGATEAEVAAATLATLLQAGYAAAPAGRVLADVHVMAGARAAHAYRAFNLTSGASIQRGDTVLVQMEVSVNGYWAELTRTFFAGDVRDEWAHAQRVCSAAQDAALAAIHDGASARSVDAAARQVLNDAGLGDAFKHGLGHGIGFQAINHSAPPIVHPASEAVLYSGMVHNLEPAVYLEGQGGLRLNDNVVVRHDGAERISAGVPRDLAWLVTPS
jgi:Xaa-Pro dipeptidase